MIEPEIHRAAEQGNAEAQFRLGEMYEMGLGVPRDGVKASELYLKAADKGHGSAQFELGRKYYEGDEGFRVNLSKAADWLRKAISQGHIYAVDYLKEVELEMEREFREQMADAASKYRIWEVDYVQRAAEQGDAVAQCRLGCMYYEGSDDYPRDEKKAVYWYRMAADQGLAYAQFSLGCLYEMGQGVPKDVAKAVELYRMVAEKGDEDAQFRLGCIYEGGQGVPKETLINSREKTSSHS
jgi:TPR repeat protein